MAAVICTLFENHYHYGGAALINSIYRNGFRGDFYVGYRGELPFWASDAIDDVTEDGSRSKIIKPLDGLCVHFVLVETDYHLTNYKADFMLILMEKYAKDATGIFYFDPDIVNKCKWEFYESWITYGVALVHEISHHDLPPSHPKRFAWKEVIDRCDFKVERQLYNYFNAGFCGVSVENIGFLRKWSEIIKVGIEHYELDMNYFGKPTDVTGLFPVGDQDALNICTMCSTEPLSEFGPEGMDFISGGWLMSHATGRPKPWKKNILLNALKGQLVAMPDKRYWQYADGPIKTHKPSEIKLRKISINIAAFLGRFYSRN
jgi:hypothetical protein